LDQADLVIKVAIAYGSNGKVALYCDGLFQAVGVVADALLKDEPKVTAIEIDPNVSMESEI
jgi:hypothetical protein